MKSSTQNNDQNDVPVVSNRRKKISQLIFELVLFAILGAFFSASKIIMEPFPNIHLLGTLTMVYTIAFRYKALIPIYVGVLQMGLYAGFSPWWVPHLYLWLILWGITMLLPRRMPRAVCCVVYPVVCSLHGFAYGALYAPFQALIDGLGWEGMLLWIAAGLKFDILHGVGNFALGLLIVPLSELFLRLTRKYSHR
jgi:energy-coupling factor transport system substrate-specific component